MGVYRQRTDDGWGLRLTEGGVNYGLCSLRKQKVAKQPGVAAFNRGTVTDLNFRLHREDQNPKYTASLSYKKQKNREL